MLKKRPALRLVWACFLMSALCGFTAKGIAQAGESAAIPVHLSVFGGFSASHLDYGSQWNKSASGYLVGAEAKHNYSALSISFEPRYGFTQTQSVSESYVLTNVKLGVGHHWSKLMPYAIAGIGFGVIREPTRDNSIVYALGAGVDYRVRSKWTLKGDLQYQFWNLGRSTHELNPTLISIAAAYRFR